MKKSFYMLSFIFSFYTANLSAQWFTQESGTTDLLFGIKFVNNNNGWVTNLNGTKLFHTTNGGTDWFVQKDFGTQTIWNFTFINDSIGYIYSHGEPSYLFKTMDGGTTWQTIYTFYTSVALAFYNENIGWGTSNMLSGSLFKTTNGGLNWQGFDYFSSFDGIFGRIGIINENSVIVPAYNFDGSYSIFKTSNGGTTWTEIPVIDNLLGGRILFINSDIGWIESDFKLYKTADGGFNWQMQVESVLDFFFVNENLGWYINSNQIYKTTDGGESWISQNSGTNNALYTLSFVDQNNGWISGDSGTILYTPNGGTPVELVSFNAKVSSNDITLCWQTATETNNYGFNIEKLNRESTNWTTIGFLEGKGTSTNPQTYSFTDANLQPGEYSYRLKQLDFDGAFEYSNVIDVEIRLPDDFYLSQNYPNPFNEDTKLSFVIQHSSFVSLKIYDVLGNEVATLVNEEKPAGSYTVKFNAAKFSSGVYFYKLQAGSLLQIKKMLLLK